MKKYRIDKSKMIGNVIFVVEGGRPDTGGTELRLLKRIFADILEYEVQELCRGHDEFIAHGHNPHFHVFALNLPKNQLTQLTDDATNAGLEAFGLGQYDLDGLAPTLLGVYDCQQEKFGKDGSFSLLSLISMALLELGILVEEDDFDV